MAIETLLKLDGIQGKSQKSSAEGWIEIFSFSNGASNPLSVPFGTGAGKVDLSSLSFQKQLDIASPQLFLNCCASNHNVIGQRIAAGGGKPAESVSMSAKSLLVTYTPQASDGSLGSKVVTGWNVTTNSKI